MIRYRKPEQDDPMILQLIESQLVPLSHMTKRVGHHPQGYSLSITTRRDPCCFASG